jgi:hypothetical protein
MKEIHKLGFHHTVNSECCSVQWCGLLYSVTIIKVHVTVMYLGDVYLQALICIVYVIC